MGHNHCLNISMTLLCRITSSNSARRCPCCPAPTSGYKSFPIMAAKNIGGVAHLFAGQEPQHPGSQAPKLPSSQAPKNRLPGSREAARGHLQLDSWTEPQDAQRGEEFLILPPRTGNFPLASK